MSALQKQLAAIAATSTHELDLKAQRAAHSKSLLFEPSIAASQSLDTVYQICIEGYEELCSLDARFARFSSNLFSRQSMHEDRVQMSAQANEELDRVLESFLALVGSRLLLKPAMKAVEWLVRRFRVHEYNTTYLLLAFLQYHSTPVFQPLLSILPSQLPPAFKFLHPYVGSSSPPPRAALVQAAVHNSGFFPAFNHYVLGICKAHAHSKNLLSFWAGICTQTIERLLQNSQSGRQNVQARREEELVLQLLPILEEGLAVKAAPELILGCYMVLTVFVTKGNLEDSTLDAIMAAVAINLQSETLDAGLSCLAMISERKALPKLSKQVLNRILRVQLLADRLEHLGSTQRTERLVLGIFTTALASPAKPLPQELLKLAEATLRQKAIDPAFKEALQKVLLHNSLDESDVSTKLVSSSNADGPEFPEITEDPAERQHSPLPAALDAVSFLSDSHVQDFQLLIRSFAKHVQSKDLDAFNRLPVFGQGILSEKPLLMTFMIRIWCTNSEANLRSAALRSTHDALAQLQSAPADLQVLVPYGLVALGDASEKVRKDAADLILALHELFVRHKWRKEKSTFQPQWGFNLLYARTGHDHVSLTSCKSIASFLADSVVPNLEECIADQNAVFSIVGDSLASSPLTADGVDLRRLKSSVREEIFAYMSSHSRYTTLLHAKSKILVMLTRVGKLAGQTPSKYLVPCLQEWMSYSTAHVEILASQEAVDIKNLDRHHAKAIHPGDQDSLNYALALVIGQVECERTQLRLSVLEQLRDLWRRLGIEMRRHMCEGLFEFALRPDGSNDDTCQEAALTFFRNVDIPTAVLSVLIDNMITDFETPSDLKAPKRRKLNDSSDAKSVATKVALTKLTFVLELVGTSTGEGRDRLITALFNVLQALQQLKASSGFELGHLQFLTLDGLYQLAKSPSNPNLEPVEQDLLRIDLVVECARTTNSPQARSAAFLLLSEISKIIPRVVLRSLMPIFTLMSTTTVKESDDFSAHVVDTTIQEVIPLLATALREQDEDLIGAVGDILQSFALAFEHVPQHRRLRLFHLLATCLGTEDSLFAVLITLLDCHSSSPGVTQLASALCQQLPSSTVLITAGRYLQFVQECLEAKPALFDALIKDKDWEHDRYSVVANLLLALPRLFRNDVLHRKLVQAIKSDPQSREFLASNLEKSLAISLLYNRDSKSSELCSELVQSVLELSSVEELSNSIGPLLEKAEPPIARKMMQTFDLRLRAVSLLSNTAKQAVLGLLPGLANIIGSSPDPLLRRSAVALSDRICEKFGKLGYKHAQNLAHTLLDLVSAEGTESHLRALSLHGIATTVTILGNDFIPLLQPAWKAADSCLDQSLNPAHFDLRLHNASMALLIAATENLSFMVTKDMLRPALALTNTSLLQQPRNEACNIRQDFLDLCAYKIDVSTVFEVVMEEWFTALNKGPLVVEQVAAFVKSTIQNASKSSIQLNNRVLSTLFLHILDLRRSSSHSMDGEAINTAENLVIETLLAYVLKINDAVFRPFFVGLVEWAETSSEEQRLMRLGMLFKFLHALSERLKSISTVYFGFVLHLCASALEQDNQNVSLTTWVLRALKSSFTHDQDDFWQAPSHFIPIMESLSVQLSKQSASYTMAEVIPATTEFATCVVSNELRRQLNSAILKLARSDKIRTRLTVVKCQQSLTQKLGEDWLAHLPEMLPFISELQEDDDEEVERETRKWIKQIEGVLGENLSMMLQ